MKTIFKFINFREICSVIITLSLILSVSYQSIYAINTEQNTDKFKKIFINDTIVNQNFGKVTDVSDVGSNITVINIQDLHCHYQTQKNINNIIKNLDKVSAINSIFVEGGYENLNFDWINSINDKSFKEKVINKLFEEGEITGTEYYALTNDKESILKGLDNQLLHKENLKRLSYIIDKKDIYSNVIKNLSQEIEILNNKYVNTKNKRFSKILNNYRNGKISSTKFYKILLKYISKINKNPLKYNNILPLSAADYPNISTYISISSNTKEIDSKLLSKQIQDFIFNLKNNIPYKYYQKILVSTDNFSNIQTLANIILNYSKENNINLKNEFSELYKFIENIKLTKNINPILLLKEEENLITHIRMALSYDNTEYEISYISDFSNYFNKYLNYSLTAYDWLYYKNNFSTFKNLYPKYSVNNKLKNIEQDFDLINSYYETNNDRNNVFISKILANIDEDIIINNSKSTRDLNSILDQSTKIIVVVAGGFHSEELKDILNNKNINYITITPTINTEINEAKTKYEQNVKNQDKILSQSLALRLASSATDTEQQILLAKTALQIAGKQNLKYVEDMLDNKIKIVELNDVKYNIKFDNGKEIDVNVNDNANIDKQEKVSNILKDSINIVLKLIPNFIVSEGLKSIFIPDTYSIIKNLSLQLFNLNIYFSDGVIFDIENSIYNGYSLDNIKPEVYSTFLPEMQKMLLEKEKISIEKCYKKDNLQGKNDITNIDYQDYRYGRKFPKDIVFDNYVIDYNLLPTMDDSIVTTMNKTKQVKTRKYADCFRSYISKYIQENNIKYAENTKYLYINKISNNDYLLFKIIINKDEDIKYRLYALMFFKMNDSKSKFTQTIIDNLKQSFIDLVNSSDFVVRNHFDLRAFNTGVFFILEDYYQSIMKQSLKNTMEIEKGLSTIYKIISNSILAQKDNAYVGMSDMVFVVKDQYVNPHAIAHEIGHNILEQLGFKIINTVALTIHELFADVTARYFLDYTKKFSSNNTDKISVFLTDSFSNFLFDKDFANFSYQEEHFFSIYFIRMYIGVFTTLNNKWFILANTIIRFINTLKNTKLSQKDISNKLIYSVFESNKDRAIIKNFNAVMNNSKEIETKIEEIKEKIENGTISYKQFIEVIKKNLNLDKDVNLFTKETLESLTNILSYNKSFKIKQIQEIIKNQCNIDFLIDMFVLSNPKKIANIVEQLLSLHKSKKKKKVVTSQNQEIIDYESVSKQDSVASIVQNLDKKGNEIFEEIKGRIQKDIPTQITFVCLSNVHRSALQEIILKNLLTKYNKKNIFISSAGIKYDISGFEKEKYLLEEYKSIFFEDRYIDVNAIHNFRSEQFRKKHCNSDYIIVADETVKREVIKQYPELKNRLIVFKDIIPDLSNEYSSVDLSPDNTNSKRTILILTDFFEQFFKDEDFNIEYATNQMDELYELNFDEVKVKMDKRFNIKLPKKILQKLDLKEGDSCYVMHVDNNKLLLFKTLTQIENIISIIIDDIGKTPETEIFIKKSIFRNSYACIDSHDRINLSRKVGLAQFREEQTELIKEGKTDITMLYCINMSNPTKESDIEEAEIELKKDSAQEEKKLQKEEPQGEAKIEVDVQQIQQEQQEEKNTIETLKKYEPKFAKFTTKMNKNFSIKFSKEMLEKLKIKEGETFYLTYWNNKQLILSKTAQQLKRITEYFISKDEDTSYEARRKWERIIFPNSDDFSVKNGTINVNSLYRYKVAKNPLTQEDMDNIEIICDVNELDENILLSSDLKLKILKFFGIKDFKKQQEIIVEWEYAQIILGMFFPRIRANFKKGHSNDIEEKLTSLEKTTDNKIKEIVGLSVFEIKDLPFISRMWNITRILTNKSIKVFNKTQHLILNNVDPNDVNLNKDIKHILIATIIIDLVIILTMSFSPITFIFLLFPINSTLTLVWSLLTNNKHIVYNKQQYESKYFSNIPETDYDYSKGAMNVTVQIPVYTEENSVIFETIRQSMKAVAKYKQKSNAKSNILICEDGLAVLLDGNISKKYIEKLLSKSKKELTLQEQQAVERILFYRANNISFIARPKENRKGSFKKASNMNHSYKTIKNLKDGLPIEDGTYYEGEEVNIYDLILLLDKDSQLHEDIISVTVPKFIKEDKLAYTQNSILPSNTSDNYFTKSIGVFTTFLYQHIFPSNAISGGIVPFIGHNGFIKTKALEEIGYWPENRVSEDYYTSTKFISKGYHGKYLSFSGYEFKEMVSRSFIEESSKIFRYTFGLLELIFSKNKKEGIFTNWFKEFMSSKDVTLYQKIHFFIYPLSYVNISSIIPMTFIGLIIGSSFATWYIIPSVIFFIALYNVYKNTKILPENQLTTKKIIINILKNMAIISFTFVSFSYIMLNAIVNFIFKYNNIKFPTTNVDEEKYTFISSMAKIQNILTENINLYDIYLLSGFIFFSSISKERSIISILFLFSYFFATILLNPFFIYSLKSYVINLFKTKQIDLNIVYQPYENIYEFQKEDVLNIFISDNINNFDKKDLINTGLKINGHTIWQVKNNKNLIFVSKDVDFKDIAKTLNESKMLNKKIKNMLNLNRNKKINIKNSVIIDDTLDDIYIDDNIIFSNTNTDISNLLEISNTLGITFSQKTIISLINILNENLYKALVNGSVRKVITDKQFEYLKQQFEQENKNVEVEFNNLRQKGIEVYVVCENGQIDESYRVYGISGQIIDNKIYDYFTQEQVDIEKISQSISAKEFEEKIIYSSKPILVDIKILQQIFNKTNNILDIYNTFDSLLGKIKIKFGFNNITEMDVQQFANNIKLSSLPSITEDQVDLMFSSDINNFVYNLNITNKNIVSVILNETKMSENNKQIFLEIIKLRMLVKSKLQENNIETINDKKLELLLEKLLVIQYLNKDKISLIEEELKDLSTSNAMKKINKIYDKAIKEKDIIAINTIIEIIIYMQDNKVNEVEDRQINTIDYKQMLAAA